MQFLFRCKYDNNHLVFIEMQTEFLWLKGEDIWGNHPWFVGLKVGRYLDEKKNSQVYDSFEGVMVTLGFVLFSCGHLIPSIINKVFKKTIELEKSNKNEYAL